VHVVLVNDSGTYDFLATANADGSFTLALTPEQTATIPAGTYDLTMYQIQSSIPNPVLPVPTVTSRKLVYKTVIIVRPDYTAATLPSKAETQLALIETEINRRISGGDATYSAANVSITKIDFKVLTDQRDKLKEIVRFERRQNDLNRGVRPKKILFNL
jgi:hypothetical protein